MKIGSVLTYKIHCVSMHGALAYAIQYYKGYRSAQACALGWLGEYARKMVGCSSSAHRYVYQDIT